MAKTQQSPGAIFLGLLEKHDLNCNKLAKEINCSQTALRLISLDKSRITTSIALRLAKVFGTKPEYWLLAQMNYDLALAAEDKALNKVLSGISKAEPASRRKTAKTKPAPAAGRKTAAKAKAKKK